MEKVLAFPSGKELAQIKMACPCRWITTYLSFAMLTALLCLFYGSANAAIGYAWLPTQSQTDGSYANAVTDIARPDQSTFETLRAYYETGNTSDPNIANALTYINSNTLITTETLAQKIIINTFVGNSVNMDVAELLTHQNEDGGFGNLPDHASSSLATALALEALAESANYTQAGVTYAVGYLKGRQSVNGGWSVGEDTDSVYVTAIVTRALWHYRHIYDVSQTLTDSVNFILSEKNVSGLWGETFESATVLLAVTPLLSDISTVSDSMAALQTSQSANGSWHDDVFQTAVALRALHYATLPVTNPDLATVSGQFKDLETGQILPGVSVTLTGPTSLATTSDSLGNFSLENLQAGPYTLDFSLIDYNDAQISFTLGTASHLDLDIVELIRLPRLPRGTVKGIITDADTLNPLPGVTVSVLIGTAIRGITSYSAVTSSDGSYQINDVMSSASARLTASLAGYASVSATGSVDYGGTLLFSSSLQQKNDTINAPVISGTITDADTGLPLSGVSVSVSGEASVNDSTDANGYYEITLQESGVVQIQTNLAAYDSVFATIDLSAASLFNFSPQLYATDASPADANTSRIIGLLVDDASGLPISNIKVSACVTTCIETNTAVDGSFIITGITDTNIILNIGDNTDSYKDQTHTINVPNLATVDVGTVRMAIATTSLITVKGVVTEYGTNLPIAGVTVIVEDYYSISYGPKTAVTGPDGTYQINSVYYGTISVTTQHPEYAPADSVVTMNRGDHIFSPVLRKTNEVYGVPSISGVITSADTSQPLEGVSITISGEMDLNALTDSNGTYEILVPAEGAFHIEASLTGYDPVVADFSIRWREEFDFSPMLYAESTSPQYANTSTITGVVIDATSNRPITNMTVNYSGGCGYCWPVSTDSDGRFTVSGITKDVVNVTVSAATNDGYIQTTFTVKNPPLSFTDIGQIRLRQDIIEEIAPDLVVRNVDATNVITDLITLEISGSLTATIENKGNADVGQSFDVLSFYDNNLNYVFDIEVDTVLGSAVVNTAMSRNTELTLSIPVNGNISFRDAPVHVWADSSHLVSESHETNNLNNSSAACRQEIELAQFQPVVKWDAAQGGGYTPIVGPLIDTNGDTIIDENDMPAVIMIHSGLIAVRGDTGRGDSGDYIWKSSYSSLSPHSTPALADIDSDGMPEVMALTTDGHVVAVNNDGTEKWMSSDRNTWRSGVGYDYYSTALTVADLDGDGLAEILAGNLVLNADGTTKWQDNTNFTHVDSITIAADLDLDGIQEVLMGHKIYRADGTPYAELEPLPNYSHQHAPRYAIANLDEDPNPEIVIVNGSGLGLITFEHDGSLKWGPVRPVIGNGAPLVVDVDGDGIPEIGYSGQNGYALFAANGSILWKRSHIDASGFTSSSAFDFDGDGKSEILYNTETEFFVVNGEDGSTIFEMPIMSITRAEYPTVADIDNDGHAEIIVPAALIALEDINDAWPATRGIMNQHAYSIDNINDDASVPTQPAFGWQTHNTFRANTIPVSESTGLANLSAARLTIIDNGTGALSSLSLRVGNAGLADVTEDIPVTFYQGDPAISGVLLGTATLTGGLSANSYQDVQLDNVVLTTLDDIYAVVDPNATISECDYGNNSVSVPLSSAAALGSVALSTDLPFYGPDTLIAIQSIVTNEGSLSASYNLNLSIKDSAGNIVVTLDTFIVTDLPGGSSSNTLNSSWDTANILAGNYALVAQLYDSNSTLVTEHTSSFEIRHTVAAVPEPLATVRVSLDQTNYHTTGIVNIQGLIQNLTTNAIVKQAALQVEVIDPTSAVVYSNVVNLGQLLPNASISLPNDYVFQDIVTGTYTVIGTLIDTGNSEVLSTDQQQFQVAENLAISLSGAVTAQSAVLEAGQSQVCTDNITNQSSSAIANLQIRQVLSEINNQQIAESFTDTLSLASNETTALIRNHNTTGLAAGDYACLIQAYIGNVWESLGYAAFTLTQPANLPPVANAGIDQTTNVGDTVSLDATASNDPDNDTLTYQWSLTSVPAGSTAFLSDPGAVNPTIVPDKKGPYIVQLIVNDGLVDSTADSVTITTINRAPVANAGADQHVNVGDTATLDASASSDLDGDILTYHWSIVQAPVFSLSQLSDPNAVMPTLYVDSHGTYDVQLIVNDGEDNSIADVVMLTVDNVPPVAQAGDDRHVNIGDTINLDASASSDADGDSLTYQWSIIDKPLGSVAELTDTTAVMPTLIIDAHGSYQLQLIVNDGFDDSDADTAILNVLNIQPMANAGLDQSVYIGETAALDGSNSTDADGDTLSYLWSITSRPANSLANLSDATTVNPVLEIDQYGMYIVQLIVNDGLDDSAPDTVVLDVVNVRPVANAGVDQTVSVGDSVYLDGSASTDADGNVLTYQWSLTSTPAGSPASPSDPYNVFSSFAADKAGVYISQLIVNDGELDSAPDTAVITAVDDEAPIISLVVVNPNPVSIGLPVNITAYVDDSTADGSNITSAEISVDGIIQGAMVAADGVFDSVSEGVEYTIPEFSTAGVYQICVKGRDAAGNRGLTECILLAVYDPDGGFVTGGGWIESPAGACLLTDVCGSVIGKANFGFVSKYKKGENIPTGNTTFIFKAGDIKFYSSSYEWLVVAGAKAKYKGAGTINGSGNYGFKLTAVDEELTPSTDVDLFRIKIWDKDNVDTVVYDNEMGISEGDDPTTAISGGSIVIHKQ